MDDSTPIQSKMVSRAVESAQKRVEGNNFDSRKRLYNMMMYYVNNVKLFIKNVMKYLNLKICVILLKQ